MPRAWARRFAGSMVSTTTVRPYSAAPIAMAAAVVVLLTPPAPQHTMTLLDLSVRIDFISKVVGVPLIGCLPIHRAAQFHRAPGLIGHPAGPVTPASVYRLPRSTPSGMVGNSSRGTCSFSSCSALSVRARIRVACSIDSVSSPAKSASLSVIPTLPKPDRTPSPSMSPSAALLRSSGDRERRDIAVDDHTPDREFELLEFGDRFQRLLNGQRLQQSHQMYCRLIGVQQLDHAVGLRMNRPALATRRRPW